MSGTEAAPTVIKISHYVRNDTSRGYSNERRGGPCPPFLRNVGHGPTYPIRRTRQWITECQRL
ncbi:MAG: hypothetical protein NTY51_00015, partial [Deltaproteobacteria bacterium]|nr:hypothetical protein [Deltaproteobacteria bacterium]